MKKITTAIVFLLLVSSFTFAQAVKKDVIAKVNKTKVVNSTQNTNTTTYDFTTGSNKYYGTNGAKELQSGVWGMIAGDANSDGFIDGSDFVGPDNNKFQSGYLSSDTNLDGFVDGSDFVPVDNNKFKGTAVP